MTTKFDLDDVVYIINSAPEYNGRVGRVVSINTAIRGNKTVLLYTLDGVRGGSGGFLENQLELICKTEEVDE